VAVSPADGFGESGDGGGRVGVGELFRVRGRDFEDPLDVPPRGVLHGNLRGRGLVLGVVLRLRGRWLGCEHREARPEEETEGEPEEQDRRSEHGNLLRLGKIKYIKNNHFCQGFVYCNYDCIHLEY